ncbi:MAG TPA: glycoside hydrolase family 3 N-terminal domain-containing protein [Chitinophagaceae bacterium]|nr:glycoside hydrolase family 3 N-terminal domain-containing protein [Chitinophagaceae bacterium]
MKKILSAFLISGICLSALPIARPGKPGPTRKPSSPNQMVEALLKKMTLEEKVGQMTQVTLDVVSAKSHGQDLEPQTLDTAMLREALLKYHVGSILNVGAHGFDRDHWHEIISEIQQMATRETRLRIPVLYGIDAIHGVTYTMGSILFPQEIGLAATWNPDLAHQMGEVTAYETRASYIPWNFSPVLDLGINPLWPRMYETLGEDPLLGSTMGAALIRGYQGEGPIDKYHVAACMKHYLGYSDPLSGKDRTPAWIPDRFMRQYFLPNFAAAVKAGAMTLMVNSAEINGVPVHASHYLLTDVLRGELGFKGVIVSDWADIKNLHDRHHIAATEEEAVRIAVMAGIDMSMVPYDFSFYNELLDLVKKGEVPVSRIDASVRRILQLKYDLGLFDHPVGNPADYPDFGSEAHRKVALQAAEEAITLLKNENRVLPLSPGAKVLVTGPSANTMRSLDGGWSYTWQGERDDEFGNGHHTILAAIRQRIGAGQVSYVEGTGFNRAIDIDSAVRAASRADAVILCLGESSYAETPGNIDDLDLPQAQIDLAKAMAGTGKPVILVLTEGRPRIISQFSEGMSGILMAYYLGSEGGDALASVLFGDTNPSGKLPVTYPRHANALFHYYRKYAEDDDQGSIDGYNPQFEFGFGLSYTSFSYSNLKVSPDTLRGNLPFTVSVDLTNSGPRKGKEVVELYSGALYASITPEVKRLRAFRKVELEPGQTQTIVFTLTPKDLSFIGQDNKPVTESGPFRFQVGPLTEIRYYRSGIPQRLHSGRID